jgi:hypothetical protein
MAYSLLTPSGACSFFKTLILCRIFDFSDLGGASFSTQKFLDVREATAVVKGMITRLQGMSVLCTKFDYTGPGGCSLPYKSASRL